MPMTWGNSLNPATLIDQLAAAGIEPLPDPVAGDAYRCAATLVDGTYLPCIAVRRVGRYADRLREMFDAEARGAGSYRLTADPIREALKSQLAGPNRVSAYSIDRIEPSPFAIPRGLLEQISGETAMSLWLFSLETHDARRFLFSASNYGELLFFDLPEGVKFSDFTKVHSLSRGKRAPKGAQYEARPYFECFVDDEPFQADLSKLSLE